MDEHRKVGGAAGAAIGLSSVSALIGLCCLGPWAVSLFGVSAAVAMAGGQGATLTFLSKGG